MTRVSAYSSNYDQSSQILTAQTVYRTHEYARKNFRQLCLSKEVNYFVWMKYFALAKVPPKPILSCSENYTRYPIGSRIYMAVARGGACTCHTVQPEDFASEIRIHLTLVDFLNQANKTGLAVELIH